MLPCLIAGALGIAALPARAADLSAAARPASSPRVADATKARQEADRQRLIAKLREETPKVREAPGATNPLDLPIFRRHDRP